VANRTMSAMGILHQFCVALPGGRWRIAAFQDVTRITNF
jgi:hypothetical protein